MREYFLLYYIFIFASRTSFTIRWNVGLKFIVSMKAEVYTYRVIRNGYRKMYPHVVGRYLYKAYMPHDTLFIDESNEKYFPKSCLSSYYFILIYFYASFFKTPQYRILDEKKYTHTVMRISSSINRITANESISIQKLAI